MTQLKKLRDLFSRPWYGAPGTLRYVFAFTPPKDGAFPASCKLIFNYASPGSSLRVAGLQLVRG